MKPGLLACLLGLQVGSSMQQMLTSDVGATNDVFGYTASTVGNQVLIGAYGEDSNQGAAYLFDYSNSVFTQSNRLVASDGAASDEFGFSVGYFGTNAIIGAPVADNSFINQGAAYIYDAVMAETILTSPNPEANGQFGYSVAISSNYAIVGALVESVGGNSFTGRAYCFEFTA